MDIAAWLQSLGLERSGSKPASPFATGMGLATIRRFG
jgi:hypothetical protein